MTSAWRAPPGKLPDPISTLIGRESEIEEIAHLVQTTRLVTLVGAPGVGKTRLALEAAHRLRRGGLDVTWVGLADLADAALVPEAVSGALASFGIEPGALQAATEGPRADWLVVVLDTCEHALESCAELVRELLESCSRMSVLATSRRRLGLPGEHVRLVASLAIPASDDPGEVEASDAARLLCWRASELHPGFDPNADLASVAAICREVDGIPLALELAAARLVTLSPAELADKLQEGVRVLTSTNPGVPQRHRSLSAAFEWSYRLLSPAEQKILRRLAVFAGDCPLSAAEQVCRGVDLECFDIVELLTALVNASLVTARLDGTTTYYGMPNVLRQLAAEKLTEAREATSVRSRHISWCTSLAAAIDEGEVGPRPELARPETWPEEIHAALRWAVSEGRGRMGLELVSALSPVWQCRGDLAEGRYWFEELASATPISQPLVYCRVQYGAARFALLAGDIGPATAHAEESLAFARKAGPGPEPWSLSLLGLITAFGRGPHRGLELLHEGLAVARDLGDPGSVPELLGGCGTAHWMAGDPAAAREWFGRCLDAAHSLENRLVRSWVQQGLGWAALATADFDLADHLLREALRTGGQLGKRQETAVTLSLLGDVARARGEGQLARSYYDEALARSRAMGARWPLSNSLLGRGWLDLVQSGPSVARPAFEEAHDVSQASGMWSPTAQALNGLGALEFALGHTSVAELRFENAREVATEAEGVREQADALFGLGMVSQVQGDQRKAESLHDKALILRLKSGYRADLLASVEAVSGLLANVSRWRHVARLCGAARSARQALGLSEVVLPGSIGVWSEQEAEARTQLGEGAFEAAWGEGAALSLEAAAAYASREVGGQQRGEEGWASLTKKERQVAALVAEGLTNQEVGERMFISTRTVSTHVSHIFEKLQISSRRQLRDAVLDQRHDLTT